MKVGPPIARARRTLFIISAAYETLPGGLNVVFAPYGVDPDSWMSVLAYDSLSYIRMRELYSLWVRVAEIAPSPLSAPPPSPQKAMTLIGSVFILPFVLNALRPAEVPSAAEPDEPSWVCIHGTTQGVV